MRFDNTSGEGAVEWLQKVSTKKLEEILATYGEERYCKKLARGIIAARDRGELVTAQDLARVVAGYWAGVAVRFTPRPARFRRSELRSTGS